MVTLFDGGGAEFAARVDHVGKNRVDLSIVQRHENDRELPLELTLAIALPRGERQRWLVEKAVELGVSRLVPLATARSVPVAAAAVARLRRAVVEASKQCGRNRLMQIEQPVAWQRYCAVADERPTVKWIGDLAARHPPGRDTSLPRPAAVKIAVGPEGDWTADEAALAATCGWQRVWLGPRVLRVETAAIVLAAIAVNRFAAQARDAVGE
jgi:16S rRNA (uracil1498-N3)-methyltransferase